MKRKLLLFIPLGVLVFASLVSALIHLTVRQTEKQRFEFSTVVRPPRKVFLRIDAVIPNRAEPDLRRSLAEELQRGGITVVPDESAADAIAEVRIETIACSADPEVKKAFSTISIGAKSQVPMDAADHFGAKASLKMWRTGPENKEGWSRDGDIDAQAFTSEEAVRLAANHLGREIRAQYFDGMMSVDRIFVNVVAGDDYSKKLQRVLNSELTKAGFVVFDSKNMDEADARLDLLLNVSHISGKYEVTYMYDLGAKYAKNVGFRGFSRSGQVTSPNDEIAKIAANLADKLKKDRTSSSGN